MSKINVVQDDIASYLNNINLNFDLIIADPPYGNVLNATWDTFTEVNYDIFTHKWMSACYERIKASGSIYVWCSIGPKSTSLVTVFNEMKKYWYFQDMIVWAKQRGRGNRRGWLFTREEILWATKLEKEYNWYKEGQYSTEKYDPAWVKRLSKEENPFKRATNVWKDIDEVTIAQVKSSGTNKQRITLHPAQKPLEAIKRIILAHTIEDDWVLDAFSGSGTTALACKQLNRNCISVEQNEHYIDIIKNRLQEY